MKRVFLFIIIVSANIYYNSILFSQQENYPFRTIQVKDGLSNSKINSITQDSYGFIWIGTNDGLNKYDGYSFKYIYPDPLNIANSLGNVTINSIYTGNYKKMWIGAGGLNKLDLETGNIRNFKNKTSYTFIDQDIIDIIQDEKDVLWLIINNIGLCTFDPVSQEFSYFSDTSLFSDNNFTSLAYDQDNNIWIGTKNGLNILNPSSNQCEIIKHDPNKENSLINNVITKIHITRDGIAWIGTKNGLSRFDKNLEHFMNFRTDSEISLSNNYITDICSDHKESIWVGTINGLNLVDIKKNKSIHFLSSPYNSNSICHNEITSVFTDKTNVLWVGTTKGLNVLDLNKKQFICIKHQVNNTNSLSNNYVNAITTDSNSIVWVGTNYGLNKIDNINSDYNITHFISSPEKPQFIENNKVLSLYFDKKKLWIGGSILNTLNINNFNYSTFIIDIYDNPIVGNMHVAMYTDSKDNIWSCTDNGINIINPLEQKSIHFNTSFDEYITPSSGHVKCISEDEQGIIWIGESGLIKYVPETQSFKRYIHQTDDPKSLSNNNINTIHNSSKKDEIWIGTAGGGLNRFNPSTEVFTNFTKTHGLPSNIILGILEDKAENLWISTSNGLVRFNTETFEINTYNISDGLPGNEFTANAFHKSESGQMFFGTTEGIVAFYPENIRNNSYLPNAVITELSVLNKKVRINQIINNDTILTKKVYATDKIHLSHKNNFVSFEFAALHFASPDKINYKYKLEGFDSDWMITDASRRFCNYSNLPGGKYVFKVIASNNDGEFNDAFAFINVIVSPPFWSTWWFISLIIVSIILLVYQYIRFREKETIQIKKDLENKVKSSIKEMEIQKEELLKKNEELSKREEDEKKVRWYTEGLAKFSDILSMNKDSIKKLSMKLVSELVSYCNSNQGGIYVINTFEKNEEQYLELMAAHAYDKKKINKKHILIGEGLIGACYKEARTKHIKELPETYIKVSSGLGEDSSNALIVIPLKHEDTILGVLELAGFNPFEEYKIEFLEQLSERITSTFFTIRINEHTRKLLQNAEEQAKSQKETEESLQDKIEQLEVQINKLDRKVSKENNDPKK